MKKRELSAIPHLSRMPKTSLKALADIQEYLPTLKKKVLAWAEWWRIHKDPNGISDHELEKYFYINARQIAGALRNDGLFFRGRFKLCSVVTDKYGNPKEVLTNICSGVYDPVPRQGWSVKKFRVEYNLLLDANEKKDIEIDKWKLKVKKLGGSRKGKK